jgi:DNA recombination protein RmuC
MENFAIIIAVLAGLIVGFVFGKKSTTTDTSQYESIVSNLNAQIDLLNLQSEELKAKAESQTELELRLLPLTEQIKKLEEIATKSDTNRAKAEAELTTSINTIEKNHESLSRATGLISNALTRSQERGKWGELQLEQILEDSGLIRGVHFTTQHGLQDADGKNYKPDFTIELPGHSHIVIDSKFPFEAYYQAMDESNPVKKEELLKKHAQDVLKHAKELSKKNYSEHLKGPKYVVMWLPFESMLSAAIQANPKLLRECMQMKIALNTPTLFFGMTTQLSFIWQQVILAENAELVRKEATNLLVAIRALASSLQTMGGGLTTAVTHYNAFRSKFVKTAFSKSSELERLGISVAGELKNPSEIEKMPNNGDLDSNIIDVEPVDELDQ